ncbi:hypothetical protein P691DRAFT_800720 [Macrolepiota fuliginosa MF-IS2]|uniref:G-protein coupled receptors family 2 profile 2 domain-containing protein n=1 Tax=Macrolepiota fuliginosa MF-IS2 TaxID=1400762 RepID=A0A9P5XL77_9AGAR|nr:hypothetical protein P691DRAFT_800720 [Macrolepiota fuliginosa MF-IS2]
MAGEEFVPIPQSQYAGTVAVNVFAILSAVALLSVALRIIWIALSRLWRTGVSKSRVCVFFHTQLGNYAACLLLGDVMTSTAGLMGLPWLLKKGITDGAMCRSQAFIMQVGNWASAYFTVAMAVHTFNSLVMKKKQSILISFPTMLIGWAIAGIAASVPFVLHQTGGDIYGPAGLSCGVRDIFPKLQFIFHLLPIFIASLLSAFLYSVIFLALRGTLVIKGGIKLTLGPNGRWDGDENYHRFVARVARSMLWYPIVYIALLVPYSIMRLLVISGFSIVWEAIVFAYVCWFLLGVVNVLLLYNTFRVLGPVFDGRSSANSTRKTMDSFGPTGYFLDKDGPYDGFRRTTFQAQVDQYRFPVPLYQTPTLGHSSKSPSQASDRSLLPLYHERNTSDNSIPSLGRPITPVDELQKMLAMPLPAAQKPLVMGRQSQQSQLSLDTSMRSLPAPPRRNVSPSSLSALSTNSSPVTSSGSSIITLEGVWTAVVPSATQQLTRPPSALSEEQMSHRGSQSWSEDQPALNQPALSAVASTFPSPAPLRPLLLSSSSSSPVTSPQSPSPPPPSYSPPHSPNYRPLLLSRGASASSITPGLYRPPVTPVPRAF